MGTNYYLEIEKCPCCGHAKGRLHLGKMSAGWCFALQVYPPDPDNPYLPEDGLNCMADWDWYIKAVRPDIVDEYGTAVDWPTLLHQIRTKRWEMPWEPGAHSGYKSEAEFLKINYAERGPGNLLRSKIDGVHCIGHDGMCDLIIGDFS
jgi:hypothetical protein